MLFELERVSAKRHGRLVLDELSCAIPAGATAIAGPSGAGKSTLLRLLNRLADADAGRILYRGQDVREREVLGLRREICLVPQVPAPLGTTVAEDVSFGTRLAGRPADVGRALELAGLDAGFELRETARLSVGEQQRVMLARALALEPAVLLLDEPTSALDGAARAAVEATLVELREGLGVSLVLVSHDEAQATRLADRVLHLVSGKLTAG